jgi:hypothetical protein
MMTATLIPFPPLPTRRVDNQERVYGPVPMKRLRYGEPVMIAATVRYDDRCGNGHNTFSITADMSDGSGGCQHEEVARYFPELAPLIKWHLVSTDGPLHYIENTMYWLGRRGYTDGKTNSPPNLEHARKSACWPNLPPGYVITGTHVSNARIEHVLRWRLQPLLKRFRAAVEALGMRY